MNTSFTLEDLRNWANGGGDTDPPIRLAVLGDPIAHSLSPQMQNAALHQCDIPMRYARLRIFARELPEAFGLLRKHKFVGANLTLPHKIAALPLVDQLDGRARAIGAINTIRLEGDSIRGFNTDGEGFIRAVREEFGIGLSHKKVLLLGAGGAARAIAWECATVNCATLVIASRRNEPAEKLASELAGRFVEIRIKTIGLDVAGSQTDVVDLVVNTIPLGLQPCDPLVIPSHRLAPHLLVFDTVPREETPLLRAARSAGARACGGKSMLLHQGAVAFEIWFRQPAPLEVMRAALSSR